MFPKARGYNPGVVGYACECKASEVREGSMIFIRSSTTQILAGTRGTLVSQIGAGRDWDCDFRCPKPGLYFSVLNGWSSPVLCT
jgi:hypothetical protein